MGSIGTGFGFGLSVVAGCVPDKLLETICLTYLSPLGWVSECPDLEFCENKSLWLAMATLTCLLASALLSELERTF